MRYLTTYLDDEINFKFGNNGSILELKAVDDHAVMSFTSDDKLLVKIKSEDSYIKTIPVSAERKIIQLPTNTLKELPVGSYDVELWQGDVDNQIIYPDEGFLKLNIHGNATQVVGQLISSITLADFEKKFNELTTKIEEKLSSLPSKIDRPNLDIKVENGRLIVNGEDVGVDLTAHNGKDGRDGHDGHTPKIEVSDEGTLVIDGIDTKKSLVGPRGEKGERGLPGRDGHDGAIGKSAYQIACDNGFDGTETEWLRSLQGNDGIDGKNGVKGTDGESAYKIALRNGFEGSENEWLNSLKGNKGEPGAMGQSAYQIAVNNGFSGSEREWLESLRAKSLPRRGPTGFFVRRISNPDGTAKDYEHVLDNGCIIHGIGGGTMGGVGFYTKEHETNFSSYPIMSNIMSFAHGGITIESLRKKHGIEYIYFNGNLIVENPVNDSSKWDWSNVFFNDEDRKTFNDNPGSWGTPEGTKGTSKYEVAGDSWLIKCWYEIGLFNENEIKSFGAVKKKEG